MYKRDDLDGLRIFCPGRAEVWLIYHGSRHHVANPQVFETLFNGQDLVAFEEADSIALGNTLNPGSCLVQATDGGSIFLVTGESGSVRKHLIPTYESFLHFGFNEANVVRVPKIVVDGIPAGREISSAADRDARAVPFRA